MADLDRRSGTINEILSIIGLDRDFNARARKYLESRQTPELGRILAGSKATLNLANRQTKLAETVSGRTQTEKTHLVYGGHTYARLVELKAMLPADRQALGLTQYVRAACDLFSELRKHATPDEIVACRRNYMSLYRWVDDLWIENGPDARKEYWKFLAVTQRKMKEQHLPKLELLWRRILLKAGTQYPIHYATVALQGLCWSDRSTGTEALSSVVLTFLRWAQSIDLGEEDFKAYCRDFIAIVDEALEGTLTPALWGAFDVAAFDKSVSEDKYAIWLTDAFKEKKRAAPVAQQLFATGVPSKKELITLLSSLESPLVSETIKRAREFFERHREHTWRSGNTAVLGQALSRIAIALLESPTHAPSTEVPILVREMGLELVRWQPNHPSGWHLWLRAVTRSNEYPGVEMILWECIRRFPDYWIFRNSLSDLQREQGRYCEAEHLLRSTIELFPGKFATYQKLATLLALQPGRLEEAISIGNLASKLSGFRPKSLTRVLRQIASGAESRDIDPEAQIVSQDSHEHIIGQPQDEMVEWVVSNGRAMRAEFRMTCPGLGAEDSAITELQWLANEAELPIARFLLAKTLPTYDPFDSVSAGVFPVAFAKAIRRLDHADWQSVLKSARSQESKWLVRVAELLLSHHGEDDDIAAWLLGEEEVAGRVGSVLRSRLMELKGSVESKGGVIVELRKRRRSVAKVLGDAVAMMFDDEIAA